jgi:hypothetical protein
VILLLHTPHNRWSLSDLRRLALSARICTNPTAVAEAAKVQADVLARKIPPLKLRKTHVDFLTAATFLDRRYHAACRDKWVDALDPALQRYNDWTEEQLETLWHEHKVNGYGWAEVAQLIPGKTDHRCMEKASHSFVHPGLVTVGHFTNMHLSF